MKIRIWTCLLWLLALSTLLVAEPAPDSFSQNVMTLWTSADGLPSDTILDGVQDARGYIWLASYDGLVRFDGSSFSILGQAGGFAGKSPRVLAAGADGSLWIGTNTTGLFRYRDGAFVRYGIEEGLPDLSVRSLALDQEGRLFVGTARGVARFDGKAMQAITGGAAAECGIASFLLPMEGGDILVGSNLPGLWLIHGEAFEPYLADEKLKGSSYSSAYLDPSNQLWLGTTAGRILRVARNQVLETLDLPELKGASINSFYGDKDGTLWIATDRGIVYRQAGVFGFFDQTKGLPSDVVSSLWRDREGSLWVGTERGGLAKFSPGKFVNITRREGLVSDSVNAIAEDAFGGLWVGTDAGLSYFPTQASQASPTEWSRGADKVQKLLKGVRVRQVRSDREGKLWFSTYSDQGLIMLDQEGKLRSWSAKDGLPTNRVRFSYQARDGGIWIGTTAGPAILKDGKVQPFGSDSGLPNLFILSAYEDSRGRIWLGTDGGGLACFTGGAFSIYTTKNGLAGNVVFRVAEDGHGRLWISTSDGLSLMEGESFISADRAAGLSGDSVYEVLIDPQGKLWIITGRKVIVSGADELTAAVKQNRSPTDRRTLDRLDGLAGQLSANAWACVSSKGVVYLPTLQGLSLYNPQSVPMNKLAPPVLVEKVEVDGKNYLETASEIRVPAAAKRITFTYTALSFVVPQRVRFQYRLEGYDSGWMAAGSRREISYTNLPPGTYRFTVRAENNDGVINEEGAAIGFRRLPYFYETLPFYLGLVLLLAALTWLAIFLRVRRLEERSRELNRLVEERTKELELEKNRSEALLRNILPSTVAEELKVSGHARPQVYNETSVLFADLVGFSTRSEAMAPADLIAELNDLFTAFDDILAKRGCERIKTLGDGYLAVCGAPEPAADHAQRLVEAGAEILAYLEARGKAGGRAWELRIGVHSGPIVGGVVGVRKYIYDVFGDTVNTAFRLQALARPMGMTISEVTAGLLAKTVALEAQAPRPVKGKGEMRTYEVVWRA